MQTIRLSLLVTGQVQGVGFRPFVYTLATSLGLSGFVLNSPEGVVIEAQGEDNLLDEFAHGLKVKAPAAARLESLESKKIPFVEGEEGFTIMPSDTGGERTALICPDLAPCAACLAEMEQQGNRRQRYSFTNCTACGPRFTITRSLPYDRQNTSMDAFTMCSQCAEEYANPSNRRFHAQPNACPFCGPHLWMVCTGPGGAPAVGMDEENATQQAAVRGAAHMVRAGKIIAIKGVGGFHLACDATYHKAVKELRRRKNRKGKPFAMMVNNIEAAEQLAVLSETEKALLTSPAAPIVLCRMKPEARLVFDTEISPDTLLVGLMLPSSPLHKAFFSEYVNFVPEGKLPVLVMTSGNQKFAPLCSENNQALSELVGMADAFVLHNRDILQPVDDSVVRYLPELEDIVGADSSTLFIRRARGYVPKPLELPPCKDREAPVILGIGSDIKNTLCLTHKDQAFVSQHIGDMENLEGMEFHRNVYKRLCSLLQVRPQVVVRDSHPGYLSNVLAEEHRLPVHTLQHHFAHAHAVLAEHQHKGPALAITLDGTGYGLDGSFWGGEVLLVNTEPLEHVRLAHIKPLLLPGGENAITEPWRVAHGMIQSLGLPMSDELAWLEQQAAVVPLVSQMVRIKVNSPETTSCGRLFDAVSALLGLCMVTNYEGQAAVLLEQVQERNGRASGTVDGVYDIPFIPPGPGEDCHILDTDILLRAVYEDWLKKTPIALISQRFHRALAVGFANLCRELCGKLGIKSVGLSGGCFQNATLTTQLARALKERGLTPLLHKQLPPNDACLSFGQVAWCRLSLLKGGNL